MPDDAILRLGFTAMLHLHRKHGLVAQEDDRRVPFLYRLSVVDKTHRDSLVAGRLAGAKEEGNTQIVYFPHSVPIPASKIYTSGGGKARGPNASFQDWESGPQNSPRVTSTLCSCFAP